MNSIQISGGLDSLVMLFFLQNLWEDSVVMWVNSGAAYPDTLEQMKRVKEIVPRFVEVPGNQPRVVVNHGFPVDVIPVSKSAWAPIFDGSNQRYQFGPDCCRRSLWEPMTKMCALLGVTHVYRGQKSVDRMKSPIRDGYVDPTTNITYHFPLQGWTRDQVWEYAEEICPSWIPQYYREGEVSSHDCWDCTAYRPDNIKRVEHLPDQLRSVVESRLAVWRRDVMEELQ